MKKAISLLLICLFAAGLFGCSDGQDNIYNQFQNDSFDEGSIQNDLQNPQTAQEDLAGELTVYVSHTQRNILYEDMIQQFNAQHPKVEVILVGPETLGDPQAYELQATVALMSGDNIDLIDLQYLPYIKYSKSGLFDNLYTYMENDPDIVLENYFTNIFEAFEHDGGLYAVPLYIMYPACRFNNQVLQAIDVDISVYESVHFHQIYQWYEKSIREGTVPSDFLFSQYIENTIFDFFEYPVYLNQSADEASFDSLGFLTYLTQVNSINWRPANEIPLGGEWISSFHQLDISSDEFMLYCAANYTDPRFAAAYGKSTDAVTKDIPIVSSNGEKIFQAADCGPLAIMAGSPNKKLAWAFIKFQIRDIGSDHAVLQGADANFLRAGIPVNRKNARLLLAESFGEDHEQEINQIMDWCAQLNRHSMMVDNRALTSVIHEISEDYYHNLISAEECARQIQERVETFMKE